MCLKSKGIKALGLLSRRRPSAIAAALAAVGGMAGSSPAALGAAWAAPLPQESEPSFPNRLSTPVPQALSGTPQVRGIRDMGGKGRVDYRIDARLEEQRLAPEEDPFGSSRRVFTLDGRETLIWTNASADTVEDLWFHVYLNAFSNNRSTHMTAAKGVLRGTKVTEGWGWTDIDAVRLPASGVDLTSALTWERPTDGNTNDYTVFRVPLPEPVGPGEQLEIEVEWSSRLPRVRRRTGTKDDFMVVAQWFPKLGVYEEGRGWNCHQFHAFSEWYADYGNYDVTLDLPVEFKDKVFGSGERTNSLDDGDRVRVSFSAPAPDDRDRDDPSGRAPMVHDFMWTADPDYVVRTRRFVFDEWRERFPLEVKRAREIFGDEASLDLREVTVTALLQPEREAQAERHLDAVCATLFFYGLWFGEYPFRALTVVDPAWGAREAGGMEYPTIVTAGTSLFSRSSMHTPESVTIHEAGHQWFYLLVGNNEFEAAWLDEGLNSFADSEVLYRTYGPNRATTAYARLPFEGVQLARFGAGASGRALTAQEIRLPRLGWLGIDEQPVLRPLASSGFLDMWREQPALTLAPRWSDPRWGDRRSYLGSPDGDPIDNWAWHSLSRSSHYTNTYSRTATVLRSMPALYEAESGGELDGQATFLRALRHFALKWRFRHPYADDFFDALEEGDQTDVDLDAYLADLFRGTGTVDWGIDVEQRRPDPLRGALPGEDGRFRLLGADIEPSEAPSTEETALESDPQEASVDGQPVAKAPPAEGDPDGGPADVESAIAEAPPADDAPEWRLEVRVHRKGDLVLPVKVRLEYEDGTVDELYWSRSEQLASRWLRLELTRDVRLRSAAVDPDRGYFLDTDRSNNAWYAETERLTGLRWSERIFTQLAHRLHWQKGIGG